MNLTRTFMRYLPIAAVLLIGSSLSLLAQKNIASKVKQHQMNTFTTLTSTFTTKVQGKIDQHLAILRTLETVINHSDYASRFTLLDKLSAQLVTEVPSIERILVVRTNDDPDEIGNTIQTGLSKPHYTLLYQYPELTPINQSTNDNNDYHYRPLQLTIDQMPAYLFLVVNVDTAFADVLGETAPEWLNIFVYRINEAGEHLPFYHYPPATDSQALIAPDRPAHLQSSYSVFHKEALVTDRHRFSVLYLPKENSYFELSRVADWSALFGGMLLTLIAAFYLHMLLRRQQVIKKLVQTRTQELSETAQTLSKESQQRNKLLEKLKASESRLTGLIHSIDGMFWEKDLINNRFNFISKQVKDISGFSVDEVLNDPNLLSSHLLPHSRKEFEKQIKLAKENQGPRQIELQSLHKDGHQIWIRLIYTLAFENGVAAKLRGVTMDVTRFKKMGAERAKLHNELVRSQEELTSLVNSIDGVLWEFDKSADRYTYVSAQVKHILGCERNDLLQNPNYIQDRIIEKDKARVHQEVLAILRKGTKSRPVEFRMINDQGDTIDIRNLYTPIIENGKVTKFRGVMLDVTKEKKIQEERDFLSLQLKQAQKLEAIGQLAAGVAHEINTPTQFVGDNIHYLKEAFSEIQELCRLYKQLITAVDQGGDPQTHIAKIKEFEQEIDLDFLFEDIPSSITQSLDGTNRIRDIVKAMKEFSHPGSASKEKIDLNHAIESTITVARNEWKYVAEIETQLDQNLPMVEVLPGEFNQVILNILVNAAHAIADKSAGDSREMGKITIATAQDGNLAHISISDTGKGMPKEIQDKIFDPFFTTKEVGKGTGQGLAIAFSVIVEKHQGQLSCESEPGAGTTFHIKIPFQSADNTGEIEQQQLEADERQVMLGS